MLRTAVWSTCALLGPVALLALASAGCSASPASGSSGAGDPAAAVGDDGGASGADDGGSTPASGDAGAGADARSDARAPFDAGKGQCTSSFVGTALTGAHGRMDGYLTAIVPTNGPKACHADSGHVHLQVQMNGVVYDVAVNTDTYIAQKDVALPDGAWAEGWHGGARLDYPTDFGLHAADFPATTPAALEADIESALAGATQISIFATPYDTTGAHDVHRKPSGNDGAIVINPATAPHALAFRFSTDTF